MPVDHAPRTRNVYRFEIEAIWGGYALEDQQLRDIEQMLSLLLVEGHGFQSASSTTTRLRTDIRLSEQPIWQPRFRCTGRSIGKLDLCSFATDVQASALAHFEQFDHDVENMRP